MTPPNKTTRLTAIVHGRVQGVGFRYFVTEQAHRLNLTGWTRNRRDRTVEVLAEGQRPDLEQLLAALQSGPSASHITQVAHDWLDATGEFDRFRTRMTR